MIMQALWDDGDRLQGPGRRDPHAVNGGWPVSGLPR